MTYKIEPYFKIQNKWKLIFFYCHASEYGPQEAEIYKGTHIIRCIILNLLYFLAKVN
jgi:hypothetical protein